MQVDRYNNPFRYCPMATLTRSDKLMVLKLIKLLNADVHTFTDTDALTNQSVGHKKYKQPQKPQNKARQLST